MEALHPRILTALKTLNPTEENPAHNGVPTTFGVLRGVSSNVAAWRPYPEANNIREIALHIAIWEHSLANRLSGENSLAGYKQWKFGWVRRVDALSEEQWKSELDFIKTTHARLAEIVTHFDPNLLDQIVGKKTVIHAVDFINGVAEHSLYHTAQIEMTKTLARQNGIR